MPANPHSDSEPDSGLDLDALRERLRAARAQRGACPPWEELRADLLPGGGSRPGREERAAHRALCPYCDAHVQEWQSSPDRTADTLEAVERHVARGVVEGARRLIAFAGSRADAAATRPAPPEPEAPPPVAAAPAAPPRPVPTPPRPEPTPTYVPPPPAPDWNAPPPSLVPREREPGGSPPPAAPPSMAPPSRSATPPPRPALTPTYVPPPPRPAPPVPAAPVELRLLVVEATAPERIPPSVFLCAQVLGAEVAHVGRIDELAGDPDLDAVCAIVFAGARPAAEWPEALRRGRDLAPGRPVVILAGGGALPTGGARRALGSALLSLDDPAELLLVALDPRLR